MGEDDRQRPQDDQVGKQSEEDESMRGGIVQSDEKEGYKRKGAHEGARPCTVSCGAVRRRQASLEVQIDRDA